MAKHAEGDDCLSIEMTLRSFPRVEPFVVRWKLPLFERDSKLDPTDLKQPANAGRCPKYFVSQLVSVLGDQSLSYSDFEKLVIDATGMSAKTFERTLEKAIKAQKIHDCKIDQTYEAQHQPSSSASPS
jgi:hypothetical protein